MPSELECYVVVVPPGGTEFTAAGRFSQSRDRQGQAVGTFVDGRRHRERADAVELDPVQLRLRQGPFETARLGGFFGTLRDALPDHWGRRVIARHGGMGEPSDFDLLLLAQRCGLLRRLAVVGFQAPVLTGFIGSKVARCEQKCEQFAGFGPLPCLDLRGCWTWGSRSARAPRSRSAVVSRAR